MVQYFDSLKKLFVISTAFDEIAFVVKNQPFRQTSS